MISSSRALFLVSACIACVLNTISFTPQTTRQLSPLTFATVHRGYTISITPSSHPGTALSMAGFGALSSNKQKKKGGGGAKVPKLKPKSQWDRYADLKQSQRVTVGVRIKEGDDDSTANEWIEVGRVRSANDDYTEVAVARQRALIAEHSKRLYPVQIPANAVLEWGYLNGEEWVLVDKSKGDDAPDGIERKLGFEGIPDKATGFYCYYHEGRLVDREEEGKGKKTPVV